jgi:hypothetical protein
MKTGIDALGNVENESYCAKHLIKTESGRANMHGSEKRARDPTPSVPPKTCPGAQNMKTGPDVHGTMRNESGNGKHENGSRSPRFRRK